MIQPWVGGSEPVPWPEDEGREQISGPEAARWYNEKRREIEEARKSEYDPLAGPKVEIPRALLRDVMTALYKTSIEHDDLLDLVALYAYPEES